jgi:hypothetical protein
VQDTDRFRLLFGPYRTPPFRYGQRVLCDVRGLVVVCGLTDASIPWLVCRGTRPPAAGQTPQA